MTWLGMKRAKKKKTRLAVVHIDEHIVMSRDAAWTYVRLPLVAYEFLSDPAREGLLSQITLALTGLIIESEGVECHLRITTVPVDPTNWAADLDARTPNPAPGWALYRDHMAHEISEAAFVTKEVYLGIMLGPRKGKGSAAASKGGIFSQFNGLLSKAEEVLELDEDVVPADEVEFWTARAREVERNLGSSYLHAVPAGAAAVARLIRQPLNPGLEVPTSPTDSRPWGPGDVQSLAEGHITNSHKSLMIEQPYGTGHMAVLSLSRFPDVLLFPAQEPWLHYVSSLPFPVEISSRFTIVPSQKVQKDVQKALRTANDMDTHMREAGAAPSLQLQEQLDTATALEFNVGKERMPFIYGRHRIVIHAPNQEELAARYLGVRNHFRDLQIDVVWSTGDQLDLMCELQPADKIRSSSYYQRQELSLLAGGMPTASAEVGDRQDEYGRGWYGPLLGETTSRVRNPVYLSPHVAPARNAPPGIAIVGAPGGGKALALDTPIPTPSGWTLMGDLAVGDEIFDEHGQLCRVTEVHDQPDGRPSNEVEFDDGSVIVADDDHLWLTETRASNRPDRQHLWSVPGVRKTSEIMRTLTVDGGTRLNHSVLVAGPLTVPDADLALDPYCLGVWLADGITTGPGITTTDNEIGWAFDEAGYPLETHGRSADQGSPAHNITGGFLEGLQRLGLVGRKHVPLTYLRASEPQRRALLAGLIDGDGTLTTGNGQVRLSVTVRELAEGFRELVHSLGHKTTMIEHRAAPGQPNGTSGDSGSVWTVCFVASDKVARVSRKAVRADTSQMTQERRHITAVRSVPSVPMRCITVDSASHLFLAGQAMIPTHNSFSAFLIAYQMTLQGVWTVLIDPKADAMPMAALPGLGGVDVLDLAHGDPGILDPFALGEDSSQSKLLAIETLRLLLGGRTITAEREQAILGAVEIVATYPVPSLTAVVNLLLSDPSNVNSHNLGMVLKTIASLPFARLCFDPGTEREFRIQNQLTIITLLGLDLPNADMDSEDYGYENRLAVAAMYLVTRRARKLMLGLDKNRPKAIVIDEAWAVTATPQGAKLIPEVARMGRSHNCALVVISQNAKDLMDQQVTNSVSTVLAFRSKNPEEIENVLKLLGMENTDDNHQTIRELRNGECLMRDVDSRIARVQIDNSDPVLFAAFDTNPLTRGKKAA